MAKIDPASPAWLEALSRLTSPPAPSLARVAAGLGVTKRAVHQRLQRLGYEYRDGLWVQPVAQVAPTPRKKSQKKLG